MKYRGESFAGTLFTSFHGGTEEWDRTGREHRNGESLCCRFPFVEFRGYRPEISLEGKVITDLWLSSFRLDTENGDI
uniref:Uncharacterized protein n=1 Tax=Vespula pensylvanica TaxID=30213 RepID=A0A834PIH9_VESPE|nr:hypothetical protein H0235_001737 [Vespula pensylvanica]